MIDIVRVPLRSDACQVANSLTPVDCIIGTHTSSSVGILPAWETETETSRMGGNNTGNTAGALAGTNGVGSRQ